MDTLHKSEGPGGSEFRRMADSIPNIVVVFSGARNVYVNPAATAITGYTQDELMAMDFWDIVHPEYRHLVKERGLARQRGESVPREYEFKIKGKQGQERWLSINASDPVDFEGSPSILIVATDVTERKFAEEELQKSEEAQRRLVQEAEVLAEIGRTISSSLKIDEVYERFAEHVRTLIPFDWVAISKVDLDLGTATYAYITGTRTSGRGPGKAAPIASSQAEEVILRRSSVLFQSEDRDEFLKRYPKSPVSFDSGLRSFLSAPLVAHDEVIGVLQLRSKSVNVYTEHHVALTERVAAQIAGAVTNALLHSEREEMEKSLRDSEERYRALAEHSPQAIFLSADREMLYANDAGARLLGAATADEIIGKRGIDFVADEDKAIVEERFSRLTSPGMSDPPREVRLIGLDGQAKDVKVASVAIPYQGGVAGMSIANDITDRKAAEKARTEQAASMARAEELQRSRARVVATAESLRSQIAQNLHGTVQNKLIAMMREVRELRESSTSPDTARDLDSLFHSLEDLIEHEIRPISQHLYPSILRRGLVPALQSLGDRFKSSIVVEMELDPELVRQEQRNRNLIQEPERLAAYRIAEEALTNVVKHANASKVVMALERGPESCVQISVRDDGQGFDPQGTSEGMGLETIKDYAEVVGGECTIRSTPGSGTEISASLPKGQPSELHQRKAMPWI